MLPYEAADAQELIERYPDLGEERALRLFTARLIARDRVSRAGGSSASLKYRTRDAFGEETDSLWLATGDDLEPGAIASLSLGPLRRACSAGMGDADAALVVQRALLGGRAPATWPALMHGYIPARYVDFASAGPVLAIAAHREGEKVLRELLGEQVLCVPHVSFGIAQANALARSWEEHTERHKREPSAIVVDRQGVLTWGDTAEQSYERMRAVVQAARTALAERMGGEAADSREEDHGEARRAVAMAVRGALSCAFERAGVLIWRTSPRLVRFSRAPDLARLCALVCATAPHLHRTRAEPLVLTEVAGDPKKLVDEALLAYRQRRPTHQPRIIVVPDLGALAVGDTLDDAHAAASAFEHAVEIIEGAEAFGGFSALAEPVEPHPLPRATPAPLAGRVVLVTGAASGIGLATWRAMLGAGAYVMITDRDERVLEAVSEWPRERFSGRFATCACDVMSERDCRHAVDATCDHFGGLDVLVSNAGAAPSGQLHTDGGDAALRASLDLNLLGHQRVARPAAEAMVAQGSGGVLLFNASKSAFHQGPDFGPYAVAKAALVSLMRQYAVDLGKYGIRSNAVNADRIRTTLYGGSMAQGLSPSEYFRANLLRRETSSQEVADAFVYLATAGATTGCIITVDGGNPAAFPR